jgi:hypothetical protein
MSAMRHGVALFACLGFAPVLVAACTATPTLVFDDGGAGSNDGSLADGAGSSGGGSSGGGSGGDDATVDTGAADAPPDVTQCGLDPSEHPAGASCCGTMKCIGPACSRCDCAGCTAWCCAKENSLGRYQHGQCETAPDPTVCPLTETL